MTGKLTVERCAEVAKSAAEVAGDYEAPDPDSPPRRSATSRSKIAREWREREAMARLAGLALDYEAKHAAHIAAHRECERAGDQLGSCAGKLQEARAAHAAMLAIASEVSAHA